MVGGSPEQSKSKNVESGTIKPAHESAGDVGRVSSLPSAPPSTPAANPAASYNLEGQFLFPEMAQTAPESATNDPILKPHIPNLRITIIDDSPDDAILSTRSAQVAIKELKKEIAIGNVDFVVIPVGHLQSPEQIAQNAANTFKAGHSEGTTTINVIISDFNLGLQATGDDVLRKFMELIREEKGSEWVHLIVTTGNSSQARDAVKVPPPIVNDVVSKDLQTQTHGFKKNIRAGLEKMRKLMQG